MCMIGAVVWVCGQVRSGGLEARPVLHREGTGRNGLSDPPYANPGVFIYTDASRTKFLIFFLNFFPKFFPVLPPLEIGLPPFFRGFDATAAAVISVDRDN